jgi:hypothetical protein
MFVTGNIVKAERAGFSNLLDTDEQMGFLYSAFFSPGALEMTFKLVYVFLLPSCVLYPPDESRDIYFLYQRKINSKTISFVKLQNKIEALCK